MKYDLHLAGLRSFDPKDYKRKIRTDVDLTWRSVQLRSISTSRSSLKTSGFTTELAYSSDTSERRLSAI